MDDHSLVEGAPVKWITVDKHMQTAVHSTQRDLLVREQRPALAHAYDAYLQDVGIENEEDDDGSGNLDALVAFLPIQDVMDLVVRWRLVKFYDRVCVLASSSLLGICEKPIPRLCPYDV